MQCDLKDCQEMVHYRDYKKHQEQCEHRMVLCPGLNCGKMVAFKTIPDHLVSCPNTVCKWEMGNGKGKSLGLPIEHLGKEDGLYWPSYQTEYDSRLFFFKMSKLGNIYSLELIMHGSQTDCDQYKADISVLDSKSEVVFRSSYHPRPINTEKSGDFRLLLPETALAKLWTYNSGTKQYQFKISITISRVEI